MLHQPRLESVCTYMLFDSLAQLVSVGYDMYEFQF